MAGNLAHQLEMNRVTWAKLLEHGVTDATELRLDFLYFAPGQNEAERLAALIRRDTHYDVETRSERKLIGRGRWFVEGTTQPMTVSASLLDDWVRWMVAAGDAHGCRFDGWGAFVP